MSNDDIHLSDQEMILVADGELSDCRAAQVHAHLASCWSCRGRMLEMEGAIANFARAYRQSLDPQLPSISGPRALLGARLAELASQQETKFVAALSRLCLRYAQRLHSSVLRLSLLHWRPVSLTLRVAPGVSFRLGSTPRSSAATTGLGPCEAER
jgi:anti-sigma factor RsiW